MSQSTQQNGKSGNNPKVAKLLKDARTKLRGSISERETTDKYVKRALSRKSRSR